MAETIAMPKLGFDMAEGTLVRWVKAVGDRVQRGEVLAEIETDKATVEVESQASGVLHKQLVEEGSTVPVGTPIAVIGEPGESVDASQSPPPAGRPRPAADSRPVEPAGAPTAEPPAKRVAPPTDGGRLPEGVRASPLARRLARERRLDLAAVAGTGPGGRILKRDVEQAAAESRAPRMAAAAADEREPLTRLRSIIARRMTASKQQAPHFYLTVELDVEKLARLREDFNQLQPEHFRATWNDLLVKAAALALREFPSLNASFDGDSVVRHGRVNIGVAVALDEGLLTVVVQDADRKSLAEIARESRELVARARQGKVRPEDIEGSTFTLSNLGMFGVREFAAIINPPEGAILAVGAAEEVPVVQEGQVRVGLRMLATLSADHRVTDGAQAARWLQVLREVIERPLALVL
jgi:pyruvate dehydrogenase E2 component (dihydrolipoamide acetyltransferase)